MSTTKQLAMFEDELAKLAEVDAAAERSTSSTAFMSTKMGRLSYRGNPVPGDRIDVVVIAAPVERLYYASKYDPEAVSGPACFAIAVNAPGMGPAATAPSPQHANCAECPHNQWGSSPTGGKGKACRETRRLIMLPADSIESADKVATSEVAALRPPVTSVKNYSTYIQTVATTSRRPAAAVVTEVSVVPNPKTQFQVNFRMRRPIEDMEVVRALIARGQLEMAKAIETAGMTDRVEGEESSNGRF
jgi:hypothetical protein